MNKLLDDTYSKHVVAGILICLFIYIQGKYLLLLDSILLIVIYWLLRKVIFCKMRDFSLAHMSSLNKLN